VILLWTAGDADAHADDTLFVPKPAIERASVHTPGYPRKYDTLHILQLIDSGRAIVESNRDSAEHLFQQALSLSTTQAYTYGAMSASGELGTLYQEAGENQRALQFYHLALEFCKAGNHVKSLATLYNNIGNTYRYLGMYEAAVQSLYRALAYAEKYSSTMSRSFMYTNLAAMLPPENTLYYLDKAETILKKEKNEIALGYLYINKAYVLSKMAQPDYDRIEEYLRQALKIAVDQHSEVLEQGALMNLGSTYLERSRPKEALHYLQAARKLHHNNRVTVDYRTHTSVMIANAYLLMGQHKAAESLLLTALNNSQGARGSTLQAIHELLSNLYIRTGEYRKALKHKDEYIKLKDSAARQKSSWNLNQLEIKYRTAQKDKEITQKQLLIMQQKRNLEIKNIWIAGITTGAISLFLVLVIVYRTYKHRQAIQENKIRILQQEQEIGQLKAMMKGEERERLRIARELHDGIGGMLTAVSMNLGTARRQYPEVAAIPVIGDAMRMLEETNEEVRKTAHNLMPDVLIKHGLEEALTIYCAHINSGSRLHIDLQFNGMLGDLDKGTELFIYRISQELIQNVAKHANATEAILQIMLYEGRISITMEDNGTGFDPEASNGGFGLQNLQYRINALEGFLSINSAKGKNTTVYIEFELEKLKLVDS
jgi:signal transduction histidine kinase